MPASKGPVRQFGPLSPLVLMRGVLRLLPAAWLARLDAWAYRRAQHQVQRRREAAAARIGR